MAKSPTPVDTPAPDPAAAGGGAVARTLFSGPAPWVSEELYAVTVRGVARQRRHDVTVQAGAVVHTNTYFGRFAAAYWQRWTEVDAVRVSVKVRGGARGMIRLRATDIAGHERTVAVAEPGGPAGGGQASGQEEDGTWVLDAPLSSFIDGGALFLEFRAVDGPLEFSDVRWSAPGVPVPDRPGAGLAIAICTFNRADDCATTVAGLASDPEVLRLIDRIYVTDQGTDHVDDRAVFQEAAQIIGARLRYLRQPNLGGAGGFSRGMFEATADDAGLDVLLMDDDVRVEPETVLRMAAFARCTAAPTLVGAQMLYLFNPDYLLASAEGVDLRALTAGLDADALGMRDQSVIEGMQERRIDAPYNAWWSCLIPAQVVRAIGLPMPYFFQWDDIEYGIRAGNAGFRTVTLPGAAVWHADFYWKDGDDFGQFFAQRNSLITAAIHGGFDIRTVAPVLGRRVMQSIVSMRYGQARTRIRAIESFLAGPGALEDGGRDALARVRAERAEFAETATLPVSAVPDMAPTRRAVGLVDESKQDLVLGKRVVQQWAGRVDPGPVAIPYEDAYWWHISLFGEAYVTDGSQTGVRHLRRDPALSRSLVKETAALVKRFRAEAEGAAEQYRAAQPRLTGRENWARLYGI